MLAAALLIALTTWLGLWQLDRARQKDETRTRVDELRRAPAIVIAPGAADAADYHLRQVVAEGVFDPASTIFIDNKVYRGVAGYEVVTLLKLEGGRLPVLVNRGWVAGGLTRDTLPEVPLPQDVVRVEGIATIPSERVLELSDRTIDGKRWQNLNLDRYEELFAVEIQPFIVRQQNDLGDSLVRDWTLPGSGADKHRAYAVQWFALAILTLVFYLALGRKK